MSQLLYYFILKIRVPSEVFYLSHYAFKLYFCFLQAAEKPNNPESPNGLPSKPHELFDIGAKSFRQAIKELEAEGLIKTKRTIYLTSLDSSDANSKEEKETYPLITKASRNRGAE